MDSLSQNTFSKLFIDIFLLMDVLGIIPIVLLLLRGIALQRQRQIIIREMFIALFVMLSAQYCGCAILKFLHISQATLYFSGFFVLLVTALTIIFPSAKSESSTQMIEEPFIVPIAIPLIAGSGVLARVMIFSEQSGISNVLTAAIISAWILSTLILFFLPQISRILGNSGIAACERLMGLLVLILSVDSLFSGMRCFLYQR